MDEKKRPLGHLLSGLADIVSDLYRDNEEAAARLTRELQGTSALPELSAFAPVIPAPSPASRPAPAAEKPAIQPALPPFEALWKVADEPIDWTEALASPKPTDGLTAPEKWTLYHEQASAVLRGDTEAYLAVLRNANPMADLMPFVSALDVSTLSSDELRAAFTARPDLMDGDEARYLSGMALRIARDLFAVLPVLRVQVDAKHEGQTRLSVCFDRQELLRVRFAFIDPVDFTRQRGGSFAADQA